MAITRAILTAALGLRWTYDGTLPARPSCSPNAIRVHYYVGALILVLCAGGLGHPGAEAQTQPASIDMHIQSLTRRTKATYSTSHAVIHLILRNSTSAPLDLPLLCIADEQSTDCLPLLEYDGKDGGAQTGSRIASIDYGWYLPGGQLVQSDVYYFGGGPIHFRPGAEATLLIPCRLPEDPGTYRLVVNFDNRSVAICTGGATYPSGNPRFVRGSAEAEIVIPLAACQLSLPGECGTRSSALSGTGVDVSAQVLEVYKLDSLEPSASLMPGSKYSCAERGSVHRPPYGDLCRKALLPPEARPLHSSAGFN